MTGTAVDTAYRAYLRHAETCNAECADPVTSDRCDVGEQLHKALVAARRSAPEVAR